MSNDASSEGGMKQEDTYVALDDFKVHTIQGDGTACGREIPDDAPTGNDRGDIDLCTECELHRPQPTRQAELESIERLLEDVGARFDAADNDSPFLTRRQLKELRWGVMELESRKEKLEEEIADAN